MPEEIFYRMPERIYLSPRLREAGVTADEIRPILQKAICDRRRLSLLYGIILHAKHFRLRWSLEIPSDGELTANHFYMTCCFEDELFDPFESEQPYWEKLDYDPQSPEN